MSRLHLSYLSGWQFTDVLIEITPPLDHARLPDDDGDNSRTELKRNHVMQAFALSIMQATRSQIHISSFYFSLFLPLMFGDKSSVY